MTSRSRHRHDEFPAEYSLAGCSPAEPASACSAGLMLHRAPIVCRAKLSKRQPGTFARVSPQGVHLRVLGKLENRFESLQGRHTRRLPQSFPRAKG